MLAGHNAPMTEAPRVESLPLPGGRVERLRMPGGPGRPLIVVGGVETGLRPLAGAESIHLRRWEARARARPVTVVGRPIPDDPTDANALLHPRASAAAVAVAVEDLAGPFAIEAESGGGRISLWLAVDYPMLVERLVLAASASETPPDSPMTKRMQEWIALGEREAWGELFARQADQLKPGGPGSDAPAAGSFAAAAALQPRPSTPERFLAELRTTLDPSSFVTERLGEIRVPALVLIGGGDRVVPPASSRLVAERLPNARIEVDPESGHTVRVSFRGYDALVEAFLAEGDAA
jgi:pimeloyl-ACP methyl ester carboxylesterase